MKECDIKDFISKNAQDKMIELFGEQAYAKYLEWKKFQQMRAMEEYLLVSPLIALEREEE